MISVGSGAFGEVFLQDGKAVKKFKDFSSLVQEYSMLRYLKNNGCVHVVEVVDVNFPEQSLTMEYYQMNLRNWIQRHKNPTFFRKILCDILYGLIELHDLGLIHGDLKPNNILLNLEPWNLVLGDCGFVTVAHWAKVHKTAPGYRDPNPISDFTHDIYSFGMCISELVCDEERKVKDSFYKSLINSCLQREKSSRPTARELLKILSLDGRDILEPRISPKLPSFDLRDQVFRYLCSKIKALQNNKNQKFRRARKLCVGLTNFLKENDIERSRYLLYLDVSLLLSSALFGGRKMRVRSIIDTYKIEEKDIFEILEQLPKNDYFMYCLMSPHCS